MSTTKDIAKTLAAKHGIPLADAELFLQQLVDTVNEGLFADRIVKIKSFGTFKLQSVKDRISVNVNTGEKVNIAGHDKVNFLPDALMKDVVNKPFAQFETVILDDDTVIDDTPTEEQQNADEPNADELMEEETEKVTTEEAITEETIISEDLPEEATGEADVTEEPAKTVEEQPKAEEESSDKSSAEDCQTEENVELEPLNQEGAEPEEPTCPVVRKNCRNYFIYVALMINILVAAVAFFAGYYASEENWMGGTVNQAKTTEPAKTTVTKKATSTKQKPQTAQKDTIQSPQAATPPQVKKDTTAAPRDTTARTHSYAADPRVRTGAYVITGVAQTVKVKKGQTLESISRHYLGTDMECYVEAVNNGRKSVNAGEELNIPALRLKKKSK